MTTVFVVWALLIVSIAGLALILPCEGCRLRRERMRRVYDNWKKSRAAE